MEMLSLKGSLSIDSKRQTSRPRRKLAAVKGNQDIRSYFLKGRVGGGEGGPATGGSRVGGGRQPADTRE